MALPVAAQPAAVIPHRLAAPETSLARLSRLVSDRDEAIHELRVESTARAALIPQQQTQIASPPNSHSAPPQTVAQLVCQPDPAVRHLARPHGTPQTTCPPHNTLKSSHF